MTTDDTIAWEAEKRRAVALPGKARRFSPNGILCDVREIGCLPFFPAVVRELVGWKYFVKPTHKTSA
jgi:hypothetical protein